MEGNDEDIASYFKQYRFWLEDGGYETIAYMLSTMNVTRNVYEPAMVTPEKQQAQTSTLDECVREIKDFIQDKSPAKIFKRNDFFEIFYEHGIKRNQEKHKLIEAGLIVTGRIRIDGKQEYWWIEKGSMVVSSQGFLLCILTKIKYQQQLLSWFTKKLTKVCSALCSTILYSTL